MTKTTETEKMMAAYTARQIRRMAAIARLPMVAGDRPLPLRYALALRLVEQGRVQS